MAELCRRIEGHETCFCFEPLGPDETDFINSAFDALAIVEAVDHPGLRMQLDAKALFANREASAEPFRAAAPHLVHFHANEPDLGVLGTSGAIDHEALGGFLRDIGYQEFVSIEQRMLNAADPLADVALSAGVLKAYYQ
jgi:sugar phosphate isomerase/epimerase